MIGRRETGAGALRGMRLFSARPRYRVIPVRAVPLAAFIPSRVPGRGRGAWGGFASERSGGANQRGARPPGGGGRIACGLAPGGGQNAWRPRARATGREGWSCRLLLRRVGGPAGPGQAADLVVAHPVEDQGEQLAGGGDLGDVLCFLPAAGDDGVLALADRVAGGVRWMASVSAQRSIRDPCLVTCPRVTLRSDSRWRGVSPAHEHSCPALRNRVTSPISATITAASTGPMPGSCWMTW